MTDRAELEADIHDVDAAIEYLTPSFQPKIRNVLQAARQHLAGRSEINEPAAFDTSPDSLKRGVDAQPEGGIVAGSPIPVIDVEDHAYLLFKDALQIRLTPFIKSDISKDNEFLVMVERIEQRDTAIRQQARNEALDEAAKFIDQANLDGPYQAIGAAKTIRALKEAKNDTAI